MATYLITGVSLGDTARVSDGVRVLNGSGNALSFGWDGGVISVPVVSGGGSGAFVALNLESAYAVLPGTAISMALSGAPLILGSLGQTQAFGQTRIENAAQAAYPTGHDSAQHGFRTVASFNAIHHQMDIAGEYSPPGSIMVGMYLDGIVTIPQVTYGDQSSYGTPKLKAVPALKPAGIEPERLPVISVNKGESGSFVGLDFSTEYAPAAATAISLPLSGAPLVLGAMGSQMAFGRIGVVNAAQAAYPKGIDGFTAGPTNRIYDAKYETGNFLVNIIGNYEPPSASSIQMVWASEDKNLAPFGLGGEIFGLSIVRVGALFLKGIFEEAFGGTDIRNRNRHIDAAGLPAHKDDSYHYVENTGVPIFPSGFTAWDVPEPEIYNSDQYLKLKGDNQELLGEQWVGGGVKILNIDGFSSWKAGSVTVINTTADQGAKPKSIKSPGVPNPSVSPRIVRPVAIFGSVIGNPLAQFPPYPKGWLSERTGTPGIDYWTKIAFPEGVSPGEIVGYPRVRDRAKRIYAPSIIGAGIFGDIQARNTSLFIAVEGVDYFESSKFSEIRSNRRSVVTRLFDAQLFGDTGIRNKTPSFEPVGYDLSEFGLASAGYRVRYLYGRGFQNHGYGHAELTQTPSLAPPGFSGSIGLPVIGAGIRTLEFQGGDTQEFGEVTFWFRVRGFKVEGFVVDGYGEPTLEFSNRTMRAEGRQSDSYGRPRLSNANRMIGPEGIFYQFPVVHMVGGSRYLSVFGHDSAEFGDRIIPEIQAAYAKGFATEGFDWPQIENFTTSVRVDGITTGQQQADRWGTGTVFNLSQYVQQFFDIDSDLNPPQWPRWTLIENRSKTIGAIGQSMALMGNPTTYNNARPILFDGIQPPTLSEYYEAGMVAYRIRRLPLQGLESPYISGWGRVYNDAFVISPAGHEADIFGESEAEKTRRYFDRIGGLQSEQISTPMISFRIRELVFEPRYSIAPPRIQLHIVKQYTRYIDGIGEDLSGMGWASLQIKFNKLTPRWTVRNPFGWSTVKNLTPEVGVYGRASDLFGNSTVRLEWRPMNPDGANMQLFGTQRIADSDRGLYVNGMRAWAFGDKLKVIGLGQPPYTEQYIFLPDDEGGIETKQVPRPSMNQYVLYTEGFKSDEYGSAHLQSNALIIESGINDGANGEPTITMTLRSINVPKSEDPPEPGKGGRVSPWTIWARKAPDQAAGNHPESNKWNPVGETDEYPPGARFGQTAISTWEGELYPRTVGTTSKVGRPKAQLSLRYVDVESLRPYRNGWHTIDGGVRWVNQFESSVFTKLGKAVVSRPPYTGPKYITPDKINALRFGRHIAEPFNRTFSAPGFDALEMGKNAPPGNPYMWQGLRIGPLMPTIPEGLDMSEWGDTWASHRIRGVEAEGFNAFSSEYQLEDFEERLRVTLATKPEPPNQCFAPVGMEVSRIGVPNVGLGVHYILPDGNANQYRKGAPQ